LLFVFQIVDTDMDRSSFKSARGLLTIRHIIIFQLIDLLSRDSKKVALLIRPDFIYLSITTDSAHLIFSPQLLMTPESESEDSQGSSAMSTEADVQGDESREIPTLLEPAGKQLLYSFMHPIHLLIAVKYIGYGSSSCGYCSPPGERSSSSSSKSYGSKSRMIWYTQRLLCLSL
jgi:hypothetical protein